ncbi:MAG: hypothetical protein V1755_01545 [Chloroflexota bacterium]
MNRVAMYRVALWLALAGAVAACAPSAPASYETIASTYHVTLTADQLSAAGATRVIQLVGEGTWQMELSPDGKAHVSQRNDLGFTPRVEAAYELVGARFTFQETGDIAFSCVDEKAVGRYDWKLDGGLLTLALVEDGCDRRFVLSTLPWERQP